MAQGDYPYLGSLKHVFHAIKTRWLVDDPMRRPQCAADEIISALRPMDQLDALPNACKNNRMFAYDVTATDGLDADFRIRATPNIALTSMYRGIF